MATKIKPYPETLNTMITLYSFNDASVSLLDGSLKMGQAKCLAVLDQLAEIGILGGTDRFNREILVRKDEANSILQKHGVFFDGVKYFEGIYQYQKKINALFPEAIQPVEVVIKSKKDPITAGAEKEKNLKSKKKTLGIVKVLLAVDVVLGLVILYMEAT
ncbi:MAG: hypothetical protein WCF67_18620 [Chitinophagaceae bacterium]